MTVNGQKVVALLDTGSFTLLIRMSEVPVGSIDYITKTDIVCVHGDNHVYPKAVISLEIEGQMYLLTDSGD